MRIVGRVQLYASVDTEVEISDEQLQKARDSGIVAFALDHLQSEGSHGAKISSSHLGGLWIDGEEIDIPQVWD